MSKEATRWVWLRSTTQAEARLVLLALAYVADNTGFGLVPSSPVLQHMCALHDDSSVKNMLLNLTERGEVTITDLPDGQLFLFTMPIEEPDE